MTRARNSSSSPRPSGSSPCWPTVACPKPRSGAFSARRSMRSWTCRGSRTSSSASTPARSRPPSARSSPRSSAGTPRASTRTGSATIAARPWPSPARSCASPAMWSCPRRSSARSRRRHCRSPGAFSAQAGAGRWSTSRCAASGWPSQQQDFVSTIDQAHGDVGALTAELRTAIAERAPPRAP